MKTSTRKTMVFGWSALLLCVASACSKEKPTENSAQADVRANALAQPSGQATAAPPSAAQPAPLQPAVTCKAVIDKLASLNKIVADPQIRGAMLAACEKNSGDLAKHSADVECVMKANDEKALDRCSPAFLEKWMPS